MQAEAVRGGALRRFTASAAVAVCLLELVLGVPAARSSPSDFPHPPGLDTQIRFWKRVFADTSENQIILHDALYLDKIYGVIDLRPLAASGAGAETLRRAKKAKEKSEKQRIDQVLKRLQAKRGAPESSLDPEERAIWELFRDVNDPNKFDAARERVRGQAGLRERFQRGIEVSRRYLPYMEEIFRREGVPVELTRLPLVESSFNVKAYSKAGAAGVWQFIPSSARIYLRMNEVLDERRDPLRATVGAARHLRDDHAALGSWPLAVTAYNHGRAGMVRAVRTIGSDDIVAVVRRYQGRGFGFASRNFYAEFVAALEIERDYRKYFGELRVDPKLRYEEVTIRDYVPFRTLARLAGCRPEELHELNPAYAPAVLDGKLYVPKGATLRVPAGHGGGFREAYAKLSPGERFAAQRRFYLQHRVVKGQTLGAIARRYKTTVAAIQVANNLRDTRRLKIGQVLKIPSG